ncbi:MAG: hypothetical protein ACI4AD_10010 [Roseburia sp.]
MSVYEKDTQIKIPDWYLKLPQKMLDRVSDIGIALSHLMTRKKPMKRTNKRNIKFFL